MEQIKSYETLSKVDVKDQVEKKGRFDYLSWAWAWHMLQKHYPGSQRKVYENADGVPYFTDGQFANVKVGIVINGIEHIDYLPITDNSNRSIPLNKLTSFAINTAIQRSTAKAIAMHGLGLNLWIGEDTNKIWNIEPKVMPKKAVAKKPMDASVDIPADKWKATMVWIAQNKDKGLDWIIAQMESRGYELSKTSMDKIKSAL